MRTTVSLLIAAACLPAAALAQSALSCSAQAGAQPPAVVELYTSEGCSSCPPADRWLSALKGRSDVLALAFHVNYWDRLGWPDRFANAATTERQHLLQRTSGAPYVYTPQVVVNGNDQRSWSGASLPRLPASPVALTLARDANVVRATVGASSQRLAGYWAVLEDGHSSRVKAGENAGETLAHDHVVTLYKPVAAWSPGAAQTLSLELPAVTATTKPRRVAFVVTDAAGAKPLQALSLGC
jgi:hypothetical protein